MAQGGGGDGYGGLRLGGLGNFGNITAMIRLLSLLALVTSVLAAAEPVRLTAVPLMGQRLSPPTNKGVGTTYWMVSPGQIDKCFFAEVDGVAFTVAYRTREPSNQTFVTYLCTTDEDFVSPAGRRVGDVVEVEFADLQATPGFEIYAGSQTGDWSALVGFGGEVATVSADGVQSIVKFADLNREDTLQLRVVGFSTGRRWR